MLATTPSFATTPIGSTPEPDKGTLGIQNRDDGKQWCLPKGKTDEKLLQEAIDFACSQGIDCSPIQPGGPCFEPNTKDDHARYDMHAYYAAKGRNPTVCDFKGIGNLISLNPSN